MDVLVVPEATVAGSGYYHLPNDANTASLCGSINEESAFASDPSQVLDRTEAERRELDICGRCSSIAGQSGERSMTDD